MTRTSVIGIDLGGTNCRGALVDAEGALFFQNSIKTCIEKGFDDFWQRFESFCRNLIETGERQGYRIEGVGLGFPGLITHDGSVSIAPNLSPLNGFALSERLGAALQLPIKVINDANAIALGEARWGGGRPFGSFLMITLGTGVGGGLILDGRLWRGADGGAGEVGHIVVEPDGYPCGCGGRGCLEQYASGTALVRICRENWRNGADCPQTAEQVATAARAGHPAAQAAFERAGRALGQVLAGIANLLNLDGVVIGGGVSNNLSLLRPALEAEIEGRAFAVAAARMQIVPATLGDKAGILGAAHAVREALRT